MKENKISGLNGIRNSGLSPANTLFWISASAVLAILHSHHYLDSDEGIVLNGAWQAYQGKVPYRDFFEFIPPGCFYLLAGLWKLTGLSYAWARLVSVILILGTAIGVYLIAGFFQTGRKKFIAPALIIILSSAWPAINHNSYQLFFAVWSAYFFLKPGNDSVRLPLVAISGLLAGVSALFLQQKGIALFIAFLLAILIKKESIKARAKQLILFAFSAAIPAISLFLLFPLPEIYHDIVIFPIFNYNEANSLPLYLWSLFLLWLSITALLLYRTGGQRLKVLLIIGLLLLLSSLPRPDAVHLTMAAFPLVSLLPAVIAKIVAGRSGTFNSENVALVVIGGLLLPILLADIAMLAVKKPLGGRERSELLSYIAANCADPFDYIYAGPFIPGIYFESRMQNPTPYSFLIEGMHTEAQFEEARRNLERTLPRCAVLNTAIAKKFGHTSENPVEQFIYSKKILRYI